MLIIGDSKSNESFIGYNCDICIAKEIMGNRKGRVCLRYQIDFNTDVLKYNASGQNGEISGEIKSEEDFSSAISELLDFYKSDRIEVALKRISFEKYAGVCIKSIPISELSLEIISVLNLCMGGFSGTELVHLPYNGTILQQPNIFIEGYQIYLDEYNKYRQYKDSQNNKHEADR